MKDNGILSGVRIVELGQLIAVPYATKLLSDMGAEIIRLESAKRPDAYRLSAFYDERRDGKYWNRALNFNEQNRNKLSLGLELDNKNGLQYLYDLISISDVFACNFTPRVMKKFGLEYENLQKIRPDIIVISSTGYGHTGPWSSFGAIGFGTEAASGLAAATGYENGPPAQPEIPYPDYTAAEHTVFAVMAALIHRLKEGEGQFIEVSQAECVTSTIPETILEYTANKRIVKRIGNSHPNISPHGCYPCEGQDKWITIAVQNDHEWKTLCEILNIEEAQAKSKDYSSTLDRWTNRNELHKLIDNHTKDWDNHKLTHLLQSNGVAAGSVMESPDLLFDKHLQDRGFYEVVEHHPSTGMPPLPYASRPWKFSETPAVTPKAAPIMGENNEFILKELLGKTDEEFDELVATQIIGNKPTQGTAVRAPDPNEQLRQGRMQRYDSDFKQKISEFYGTDK